MSSYDALRRALETARDEADECEERGHAYHEAGHDRAAQREFARRVLLDRRVVSLTTALAAAPADTTTPSLTTSDTSFANRIARASADQGDMGLKQVCHGQRLKAFSTACTWAVSGAGTGSSPFSTACV